jgi:hypothetical protein
MDVISQPPTRVRHRRGSGRPAPTVSCSEVPAAGRSRRRRSRPVSPSRSRCKGLSRRRHSTGAETSSLAAALSGDLGRRGQCAVHDSRVLLRVRSGRDGGSWPRRICLFGEHQTGTGPVEVAAGQVVEVDRRRPQWTSRVPWDRGERHLLPDRREFCSSSRRALLKDSRSGVPAGSRCSRPRCRPFPRLGRGRRLPRS